MTHFTDIVRFQDNRTVEAAPDVEAVDGPAGADSDAPNFAAIQHSYEAAKASIADFSHASPASADGSDPLPGTEKIDLRNVKPPPVPAALPETEGMSVAARYLAEHPVHDEVQSQATSPAHPHAPSEAVSGRRLWWRDIRSALHGVLPAKGREA